jgi:hypothetical protein
MGIDKLHKLLGPPERTIDAELVYGGSRLNDFFIVNTYVKLANVHGRWRPLQNRERGSLGLSGKVQTCCQQGGSSFLRSVTTFLPHTLFSRK